MMKGLVKTLADRFIPPSSNRRMLFRALRDISRNPSSFGHRINAANFSNFLTFRQLEFTCPICATKARPLYDFPDIPLRIEHKIGVLRETLQCNHCIGSMRQRSLAVALLGLLNARWGTEFASIAAVAAHGLEGLRILDTDNFSAISNLLRNCSGHTRCSYIPRKPWGTLLEPNYFNEDLQHLTFSDQTFDIVLTSDVMEHVRDCDSAHREIFRVLKCGGAYIFNVPFEINAAEDIQLVDTSTQEDVYLCKPQIHGDILTGGVLAYRVFGRRLITKLEALGFQMEFLLLQQANRLIIDGDVFVAHKPHGRVAAQ
jgi:SAM-dependent methyltransferase